MKQQLLILTYQYQTFFLTFVDNFCSQVASIEKMEDTSLLPNPIIISVKSKTAFQFIELKERDTLVENLCLRLKQVKTNNLVLQNALKSKDMVLPVQLIIYLAH